MSDECGGRGEGECLSVYLFYAAGSRPAQDGDRLIIGLVEPFIERCRTSGWIDGYFFVRYFVDGPHLRLRLFGAPAVLATIVRPALLEHVSAYRGNESSVVRVQWAVYQPEIDRYGGHKALGLAERVFCASSDSATAIIRGIHSGRSNRLGQGLLSMLSAFHAFFPDRAQAGRFAQRYAVGYLHSLSSQEQERRSLFSAFERGFERQADRLALAVNAGFEQLEHSTTVAPSLSRYYAALCDARESLRELVHDGVVAAYGRPLNSAHDCANQLVPSYVHMMSNRLGLTIAEETYLSHLVSRGLAAAEPA